VHRYVARTARVAGIGRLIGPHALRRTVGTVELNPGIPLRDIQHLLRHTRPETTLASYDFSGDALERHASHQVAGFLAGWAGCPADGTPSPAPRCPQGRLRGTARGTGPHRAPQTQHHIGVHQRPRTMTTRVVYVT
jgi:hypothetical protein